MSLTYQLPSKCHSSKSISCFYYYCYCYNDDISTLPLRRFFLGPLFLPVWWAVPSLSLTTFSLLVCIANVKILSSALAWIYPVSLSQCCNDTSSPDHVVGLHPECPLIGSSLPRMLPFHRMDSQSIDPVRISPISQIGTELSSPVFVLAVW